MNRRAFVFSLASFAAALAAIFFAVRRKLRVGDAHVEPRHLYAVTYDDGDEPAVYVSTSPELALAAAMRDGWGNGKPLTIDDVDEIPDGELVQWRDDARALIEEPAGLIARSAKLVDVCVFCDGHYC